MGDEPAGGGDAVLRLGVAQELDNAGAGLGWSDEGTLKAVLLLSHAFQWMRRFLRFHGMRHPLEMGEQELNAFLTHLATLGQVSASTQNQALSASLFLCRKVLGGARSPRWCGEALVQLLYGSGLQLMAALRLRIEDVDC